MAKLYKLDSGEIIESITKIAKKERIKAASILGIGGLRDVTIAYYNHSQRKYEENKLEEFMELTSLSGNISIKDREPFVHVHVNLAKKDNTVVGGHLIRAEIFPFVELVIEKTTNKAERFFDENLGLNVLKA